MAWATAITDLRSRLFDTPNSRLRWRKKVFGDQDSANKVFKSFEDRRVTDFSVITSPLGVFVNGTLQVVDLDDPITGEFALHTAPATNDDLRATYYYNLFIDDELSSYLSMASDWLGSGSDYTIVQEGLRAAALSYAGAEAFQNMAVRVSNMPSEEYRLEDSPDDKTDSPSERYLKVSQTFRTQAKQLRDAFYTRQGQSLQPLYGVVKGAVRNIP